MPKPCAYCLIRSGPEYRRDAFHAGLTACGYEVRHGPPGAIKPGDVLAIWNRYQPNHDLATRFEVAGGTVLVAENGYLRGRHDGGSYYALACHGHNGSGWWPDGGPERWNALDIDLMPWRSDGGHVLVCPNRSFGMPGLAMPPDWANDVRRRLAKLTKREVRLRPHPGNDAPRKPLAEDLAGCWCVIVWASSAGVHALVAGIPVICESPWWICKAAAMPHGRDVESPWARYAWRLPALHRLAWAQWSIAEIQSGEAFDHLLRPTRQGEVAASP